MINAKQNICHIITLAVRRQERPEIAAGSYVKVERQGELNLLGGRKQLLNKSQAGAYAPVTDTEGIMLLIRLLRASAHGLLICQAIVFKTRGSSEC